MLLYVSLNLNQQLSLFVLKYPYPSPSYLHIGFIDGFVTDDEILTDEMFADASLHNPNGAWQMIFGLNTMPEYRNRGVVGRLIEAFIELAREEKRKGVILTCKEEKIHYYAKFGFVNEGESVSDHGGAKWYQMRVVF